LLVAFCLFLSTLSLLAQAPGSANATQTPPNAAAPPPASSTQAVPSATISVNARLVNLPVIVRDKKGDINQSLTRADFSLVVDGHPQTIRYFDRDNDLPLTLGLLVDVSGSVRNALDEERTASESFLDQMMQEPANRTPDKAFLIQFAHEAELLQDLTPSRPKLREALNELGTPPKDEAQDDQTNTNGGGYGRGGGRRGGSHGGTTLYDAIFLASDELMQKQQGRKALVVLTDGEDRGSKETLASAIAAAQKSETVVYAMYFKGEEHGYGGGHGGGFGGRGGGFPGGGGYPGGAGGRGGEQHVDGKKVLLQITDETGGRMFEVSSKQNFAAIYTQIAEELRSQYRLGFTPDAEGAEEGLHRVNLTVPKDKKLIVQTRDGYYTK
jgi:VWFA-related protein